jgi:hypothetical protein
MGAAGRREPINLLLTSLSIFFYFHFHFMLNKVFHLYTIYYTIFQQVMAQELEFGQVHTNNMTPHDERE